MNTSERVLYSELLNVQVDAIRKPLPESILSNDQSDPIVDVNESERSTPTIFSFNGEDAVDRYSEVWDLSTYAMTKPFPMIPLVPLIDKLSADLNFRSIPDGWQEISHSQLGMDNSTKGLFDYHRGTSGIAKLGSQALVFGKYDGSDNLTEMTVSFVGTNDPLDVLAYVENVDLYEQITGKSYIDTYDKMLNAVKNYAIDHGLESTDMSITGYSLGGGIVNDMYGHSKESWDGFYQDSQFFGNEAYVTKDGENILNFGFENDAVHHAFLDGSEFVPGVLNLLDHSDAVYDSSIDNVVLFTEA